MPKYAVGTTHNTPVGPIKVLEYTPGGRENGRKVHPRAIIKCLDTGYVTNVQTTNIANGKFKDYRQRTVYGVGYLGSKINIPSRESGSIIRAIYDLWANMLKRTYGCPDWSYSDVWVDKRWQSFMRFMETSPQIPGYKEWERDHSMHLDKDIRVPGSRVYSVDTCMFVTAFDNVSEASYRRWAKV